MTPGSMCRRQAAAVSSRFPLGLDRAALRLPADDVRAAPSSFHRPFKGATAAALRRITQQNADPDHQARRNPLFGRSGWGTSVTLKYRQSLPINYFGMPGNTCLSGQARGFVTIQASAC